MHLPVSGGARLFLTYIRKVCGEIDASAIARSQAEEKLPQLAKSMTKTLLSASFFEAVPDAMVAVNPEGEIVQVNSQTERLFGYTQGELIGQKVEMLVPISQRDEHHHHRERFHEQPQTRRMGAALDLRGRRKDGSEFPVEISLSPREHRRLEWWC